MHKKEVRDVYLKKAEKIPRKVANFQSCLTLSEIYDTFFLIWFPPTLPTILLRLLQRDVSGQFNRRPPSGVWRDIECWHVSTKVGFFPTLVASSSASYCCTPGADNQPISGRPSTFVKPVSSVTSGRSTKQFTRFKGFFAVRSAALGKKDLNFLEYAWICLNMLEFAWICLNLLTQHVWPQLLCINVLLQCTARKWWSSRF